MFYQELCDIQCTAVGWGQEIMVAKEKVMFKRTESGVEGKTS